VSGSVSLPGWAATGSACSCPARVSGCWPKAPRAAPSPAAAPLSCRRRNAGWVPAGARRSAGGAAVRAIGATPAQVKVSLEPDQEASAATS